MPMMLTIAEALSGAAALQAVSESWQLDAEILLAHAMGVSRANLRARPELWLDEGQQGRYRDLIERRSHGEPVAYLLGSKGFWDFELVVSPAVLIPRPETERLVELALERLRGREQESLRIADLGTGSGAIALALARHSPNWQVVATDISDEALALAQTNAALLGVTNIEFMQASWCDGFVASGRTFDLLVSNPPYVAAGDAHLIHDGLPFEPTQALVAGANGLADIISIAENASSVLKKDSWLLLEHGFDQGQAVAEILTARGYSAIDCWKDYAGQDRVSGGLAGE